jgi:hypothetical protein
VAAGSYATVLELFPQYRKARDLASFIYHEKLFDYQRAFAVDAAWVEHNPNDNSVQPDFIEKHFTTARFEACVGKADDVSSLDSTNDSARLALQALAAACLLGSGQSREARVRLAAAAEVAAAQPRDFKFEWNFTGTRNFVATHPALEAYRLVLTDLFIGLENASRTETITALDQAIRALE